MLLRSPNKNRTYWSHHTFKVNNLKIVRNTALYSGAKWLPNVCKNSFKLSLHLKSDSPLPPPRLRKGLLISQGKKWLLETLSALTCSHFFLVLSLLLRPFPSPYLYVLYPVLSCFLRNLTRLFPLSASSFQHLSQERRLGGCEHREGSQSLSPSKNWLMALILHYLTKSYSQHRVQ